MHIARSQNVLTVDMLWLTITTVVSPNRLDNTFYFYGRTRTVFFDVIKTASNEIMIDLDVRKLGLKDLLDSEFSGREL